MSQYLIWLRNSSANPENQKMKIGMTKSAITLTPPTIGRPADKMPDFSSFSSADKNKIITTLLYFFSSAYSFWVLAIGRWSADDRPRSRPMSYLNKPLLIERCVGRPSADHRPIVARLKGYRPTIGQLYSFVFF